MSSAPVARDFSRGAAANRGNPRWHSGCTLAYVGGNIAGQTLRILPRTDYNMNGLSGGGASGLIVIARKIDTSMWRECVVLARVHQATWPSASTISLIAAPDGYTDEDPSAIWNVTPTTLITFTQGSDITPVAKNATYTAPFVPLVQLQLKFALASVGGTFTPSVSVDLNLKGD